MRKNSLKKNISYERLLGRVKTDTLPQQRNSNYAALYAPHITWILGVSGCERVSDAAGSAHVAIRTRKAQFSHVPVRSRHGGRAPGGSEVGGRWLRSFGGERGLRRGGPGQAAAETGTSRLSPCIRAGLRGALPSHRPNAKPAPGRRALVPVAQAAAAVAAR